MVDLALELEDSDCLMIFDRQESSMGLDLQGVQQWMSGFWKTAWSGQFDLGS